MNFKEFVGHIATNKLIKKQIIENRSFRPLVERFVAGETREQGLEAVRQLNNHGKRASLDFLGEEVHDEEAAVSVCNEYLRVLDEIYYRSLNANISLKLTQMGLAFDPDLCRENVAKIAERAREQGNFVRIDMESSQYTQATLDLFYDLYPEYPNLGVVMQAYLYRTQDDTAKLIERRARVRLCKGAYQESAAVAFADKKDVDDNYVRLMEALLTRGNFPAIATHDQRMLQHAKKFGVKPSEFEFQMLYGIRRDLQEKLVEDGYGLRVYVPYGTDWYPYFTRRIGERPANAIFVLKSLLFY